MDAFKQVAADVSDVVGIAIVLHQGNQTRRKPQHCNKCRTSMWAGASWAEPAKSKLHSV